LGVIPEDFNNEHDRHSIFLRHVLGMPECHCENSIGRIFWILDYEKSLSIEGQKIVIVKDIADKKSGDKISEIEYDEQMDKFNILSAKVGLIESEQIELKVMEKWFKNLVIEEQEIIQESTTDYLVKCGVKVNELLVSDPEDTEEGVEMARPIIKDLSVDGIIWDSLQAAVPRYVKDRDAADATMGAESKSNGLLMRHIFSAYASKDLEDEHEAYKPAFFMNSQMRSSLGGFIAKQDSFSGGHAVAHACSFIGELKKEKYVNKSGVEVANFKEAFYGQKIRMRAEKNKLAAPGNMYEITYYFKDADNCKTGEIDHTSEIITLGIENGKIERRGNTYYATENDSFVGIEKLITFFRENPEFVGKVYKNIKG
jgi:RecA/RadA recombinase